jgi:hypothetical protein
MARQSISFTKPNDEWLKAQLDNQEYLSGDETTVSNSQRNRLASVGFNVAKRALLISLWKN